MPDETNMNFHYSKIMNRMISVSVKLILLPLEYLNKITYERTRLFKPILNKI